MADTRRDFIKNMALLGFFTPAGPINWLDVTAAKHTSFAALEGLQSSTGDEFWKVVQESFSQSAAFTNLENGYFSPSPLPVLNQYMENVRMLNANTSYYMRVKQTDDREEIRAELAKFAGVDAEELAMVRNTTEAMEIVLLGLPLQKGDEVVYSTQDYYSMQNALKQRATRDGIVLKAIDLPLLPQSDDDIINAYQAAITTKTRLLHVTHMINTTGHILPVKQICDMAHAKGIEVIVDGAHTFAHINFEINDLGCDYYATSLHKWLCNPLGSGLLWMKREKIEKLWPLFADIEMATTDIRRFEHYGTYQNGIQLAHRAAIKFHNMVGSQRKEDRLRYLKNYWVQALQGTAGIRFNTPFDDARSCAIANVAIKGYTPAQLTQKLYDDYKIFTVAIDSPPVQGVRITPHLYTTTQHLDKLVDALKTLAKG
jgi:selenocysteine lyase/cysteine desulfurase